MDQVFKRLNIEWGPKVGASLDKVLQFITKPTPESAAKAEDSISSLFKETFTAENIAALIGKSINLANIPGLIIGALIDKPIQEFLTNLSAELFTIPPRLPSCSQTLVKTFGIT